MVSGVSSASDHLLIKFLENHPMLEELSWAPINAIKLSSSALPSLKRLKSTRRVMEALENTEITRPIEDLDIWYDSGRTVTANNIEVSALRRVKLQSIGPLDSIRALAERFTGITWLSMPKCFRATSSYLVPIALVSVSIFLL